MTINMPCEACEYFRKQMDALRAERDDARAGGLEKAIEIIKYHHDLPDRTLAFKTACQEITTSCLATVLRIRRGEYENPTSEVMSHESRRN